MGIEGKLLVSRKNIVVSKESIGIDNDFTKDRNMNTFKTYCKRRKSGARFPDRKANNRLCACHCIAGNDIILSLPVTVRCTPVTRYPCYIPQHLLLPCGVHAFGLMTTITESRRQSWTIPSTTLHCKMWKLSVHQWNSRATLVVAS